MLSNKISLERNKVIDLRNKSNLSVLSYFWLFRIRYWCRSVASKAYKLSPYLLGNALMEVMRFQNSYEMVVKKATTICAKWEITSDEFYDNSVIKVKKYTLINSVMTKD